MSLSFVLSLFFKPVSRQAVRLSRRYRIRHFHKECSIFLDKNARGGGGRGRTGQIKNWMTSIVFSHVGDLGNVYSDERGMISTKIVDHLVSLVGEYSVLGRSFVVSWSNLLTQLYSTSWFEYFPACSWCPFLGHERRSWQATDGCCGCYGNVG